MGVRDMLQFLERWNMDVPGVRRRMILAPVPRERERWYALWLLTQGWTAQATAEALERDPTHHRTVGVGLRRGRACGPDIRADRWFPPALERAQQTALKGAVQELPANSGIELANWNWKVVCQYASQRFGISLSRSACLNYLHRLGFAFKRPKKRLLKADDAKRESFLGEYAALREEARRTRSQDILRRRGPFPCGRRTSGQVGAAGRACPGGLHQPEVRPRRPATTRRCAWRPARWSGWNWRGTATQERRQPSWDSYGSGMAVV